MYRLFLLIKQQFPLPRNQVKFADTVFIVKNPVEKLHGIRSQQKFEWYAKACDYRPIIAYPTAYVDFWQNGFVAVIKWQARSHGWTGITL